MRSVVLFGDSLTQRSYEPHGWGSGLANSFIRKVDVINRGYGGYNTALGCALLDKVFPVPHTGQKHWFVTVFFGANDAAMPSEPVHVPLEEYKANLTRILSHVRQTAHHVILVTPPPVHGPGRLQFQREKYGAEATGILERTDERSRMYASACREVAVSNCIPCLDLNARLREVPDWGRAVLCDGLHFTADGQQAVLAHLLSLEVVPGRTLGEMGEELERDSPAVPDLLEWGRRAHPEEKTVVGLLMKHPASSWKEDRCMFAHIDTILFSYRHSKCRVIKLRRIDQNIVYCD